MAGIVPVPRLVVERAIGDTPRVYVLISNSADETLIGGRRREVQAVVDALGCSFVELPIVSTVHCEIGRCVEAEYRALHDLPTSTPAGITFYSGVWARPYQPDRVSRGRRDHRAGHRKDRLSRRDRAGLCRRGSRFPGDGSRGLLHSADRPDPGISPASGACRMSAWPRSLATVLDVLASLIAAPGSG